MTEARSRGATLLVQPDRVEASLWRVYLNTPDRQSRQLIFDHYQPFARKIARARHAQRRSFGDQLGDIEQLAYEALLQAITRFDPARGVPFEAFARPRVNGHISNGLAQMSEAAAQHRYRQRAERDRLQSLECGRHAADGDALGALAELAATLALGLILDEGANADPDLLPDPQASAYDSLAWAEMNHKVAETIEALPEREAYIIRNHYRNGVSFQQIATVLGLSKGRVSQIHRSALMRMREQLARFR